MYFLPPPPQFLFSHLRMLFNLHKQNKEQRVMDFITGELRVKGVTALCYLHLLHLFPSRQFLIQTRGSGECIGSLNPSGCTIEKGLLWRPALRNSLLMTLKWSACWVPTDTSTFPGIQLDWVLPFLL